MVSLKPFSLPWSSLAALLPRGCCCDVRPRRYSRNTRRSASLFLSRLAPLPAVRLLVPLSPSPSPRPTRKFNLHGMSKVPFEPAGSPLAASSRTPIAPSISVTSHSCRRSRELHRKREIVRQLVKKQRCHALSVLELSANIIIRSSSKIVRKVSLGGERRYFNIVDMIFCFLPFAFS